MQKKQKQKRFLLLVNNQRKLCMSHIMAYSRSFAGKNRWFLSLWITFAQGRFRARIQDLKCSAGFRTSEISQQHIIIHISSLWGSTVFFKYIYLFLRGEGGPVFLSKKTKATVPLKGLMRLLAEACSPIVRHVFLRGLRLSLGVFFPGRLPVRSRCHAELRGFRRWSPSPH